MARDFDLSDILSITTGRLVSSRHMEGVYEILNYMTGDSLFTHQLSRAAEECRPRLLEQHPELAAVELAAVGQLDRALAGTSEPQAVVNRWVDAMARCYGRRLAVEPLAPGTHRRIDPISEAVALMGGDRSRVVPVVVDLPVAKP